MAAPQPEPPPNATLISAYGYNPLFSLADDAQVTTFQIDFGTLNRLSQNDVHDRLNQLLSKYAEAGQTVLGYMVWEEVVFGFHVPDEICIGPFCIGPFCIGPFCWSPPGAGQDVVAYRYRFWIISRDVAQNQSVRGLPVLGILAILGFIIVLITQLTGIWAWASGQITFRDIKDFTLDVIKAPGENLKAPISGLTGPLMALGLVMVAGGIFIPMFAMRVGATVPGPGGSQFEAQVGGGGGAPAAPRRRR